MLWRRFSIHVQPKSLEKHELQRATEAFPLSIEGCSDCYHCGFHAESSYGAASYFIKRANGGNILMDSPRWNPTLAKRIKAMGGVKSLVLSHQDDVAGARRLSLEYGHNHLPWALICDSNTLSSVNLLCCAYSQTTRSGQIILVASE